MSIKNKKRNLHTIFKILFSLVNYSFNSKCRILKKINKIKTMHAIRKFIKTKGNIYIKNKTFINF